MSAAGYKTIFPMGGDRNIVHKDVEAVLYHFLLGKPFDFVDMMVREIKKTRSDTRMLMSYAHSSTTTRFLLRGGALFLLEAGSNFARLGYPSPGQPPERPPWLRFNGGGRLKASN